MYINVCGVCVYICMYVVCVYIYISMYVNICICIYMVSLVVLVVKNLSANAGDIRDAGSIPGLERSPGRGHGNPLWCSCLENPMDKGAWQATGHRVAKSQT